MKEITIFLIQIPTQPQVLKSVSLLAEGTLFVTFKEEWIIQWELWQRCPHAVGVMDWFVLICLAEHLPLRAWPRPPPSPAHAAEPLSPQTGMHKPRGKCKAEVLCCHSSQTSNNKSQIQARSLLSAHQNYTGDFVISRVLPSLSNTGMTAMQCKPGKIPHWPSQPHRGHNEHQRDLS